MPGVLIIEAMAQAGGMLLMNEFDDPESKVVYLASLDDVKFRRPVIPGDALVFELEMVQLRGRVCRMQGTGRVDGTVVAEATFLACAGLNRLDRTDVPATPIAPEDMLPAIAQGAIGIERRLDDTNTAELLAAIHDTTTGLRLAAERAFLFTLDGSCETPIAGLAELDGGTIRLRGEVLRPDGSEAIADETSGPIADGPQLGTALARALLSRAGEGFFDWH